MKDGSQIEGKQLKHVSHDGGTQIEELYSIQLEVLAEVYGVYMCSKS